jgi:ATP-dependent RNA helicase DeaD
MTQMMRDRVMNRFRKSGLEFLVATDVAARGIDVENIEVVFNYDLPYDGEDYVHRIGRTGRKGRSGRAISFASGREVFQIRNIERYTNTKIHRGKVPTEGEVEEARTNTVLEKVRVTLKSGEFKRQDQLIERLLEEGFSSTDIASALLHQLQSGESQAQGGRSNADHEREPIRQDRNSPRTGSQPVRWESPVRSEMPPRQKFEAPRPPQAEFRKRPHREDVAVPKAEARPERAIAPAASTEPKKPLVPREKPSLEQAPAPEGKHSRRTPTDQTRLFMNLGAEMGVAKEDLVEAVLGTTGLPQEVIGTVDVRERHLFFDVASEHSNRIISKLNRAQIKGRRAKVKLA